jgi:hypothetical protein
LQDLTAIYAGGWPYEGAFDSWATFAISGSILAIEHGTASMRVIFFDQKMQLLECGRRKSSRFIRSADGLGMTLKLTVHKVGELGLWHAKKLGSLRLVPFPTLDNVANLLTPFELRRASSVFRTPKVGEDICAAL